MASVGMATAPEFQPPSPLLFTREIATIATTALSRELDCRLAILRGLIETLKEDVDRNLSWFNQLGKTVAQVSCRIRRECGNTLTPTPSRGSLFAVRRELRAGTVLIPLQAAESSSMGQGRRQG